MHPRPGGLLSLLFLLFGFLGLVQAAEKDLTRLGNRTIERTVQLRTHSIFAPYIDQDLQNRWWDFGADAYINTNKHIRLTRARSSQMGWLWSRLPLTASNFIVEVEFKVSGESSHLFGDGLAMWLTKERVKEGPVFGNQDDFEGLGIMLDTYANDRHNYAFPRVQGVLLDGKTKYNYGDDGESQAIGGCSANFRKTNVGTKLKLTYVKGSFIDLKIQYKAWDEWTDCFYIEGKDLPENPYLGFSAMTGDVVDNHDIISVSTNSAVVSAPDNPPNKYKASLSGSGGSWFGFLFKLILFAGVCAGGYYGWMEYQRRNRYGGMGNFGGGGMGGMGGYGGGMYDNKRY